MPIYYSVNSFLIFHLEKKSRSQLFSNVVAMLQKCFECEATNFFRKIGAGEELVDNIWDALGDLLLFLQFENVKNTHEGVLLLVKLQAEACNLTEINSPP